MIEMPEIDPQEAIRQVLHCEEMLYTVVHGLEGCRKSSMTFKTLNEVATTKRLVLFGFKSYGLMAEQRRSWIKRFNLKESDIVILGSTQDDENKQYLTDQAKPLTVPVDARFVFMSQAAIQRCHHNCLKWDTELDLNSDPISRLTKNKRGFQRIIIDEFDFTMCLVPRLAYIMTQIKEINPNFKRLDAHAYKWVSDNFTRADAINIQGDSSEIDKYHLANWITASNCPITFLSSEILATEFLEKIGFVGYKIPYKDFTNNTIHCFSSTIINRHWFGRMNVNMKWNELGFKYIISDYIQKSINEETEVTFKVCPHIVARGSNGFAGEDILTVLSHINQSGIVEIMKAFETFNKDIDNKYDLETIEALFYRDRLMQAVGRVLGFRSEWKDKKETWLIVHESILRKIFSYIEKNNCKEILPYYFKKWDLKFDGMEEISEYVQEKKKVETLTYAARDHQKKIMTYDRLDDYFELDNSSVLKASEIKKVIIDNDIKGLTNRPLQPAKVAKHFGLIIEVSSARINGNKVSIQVVKGLRIK